MTTIIDYVRSGDFQASSFNYNNMNGDGCNKGLIEVFGMRFDMRKVLLNEFLDNRDFSTEVKTALRCIFNNNTSYRAGQYNQTRARGLLALCKLSAPLKRAQVGAMANVDISYQQLRYNGLVSWYLFIS